MKKGYKEEGITLVSLIITIIILLILVGVTLTLVIGENGLITKTKQGASKYEEKADDEKEELINFEQEIGRLLGDPKVPEGFKHIEGTVEEGYVIQDKSNGNEFVWVPVDVNDFKLSKWRGETLSEDEHHEDKNNATYKAMYKSVIENGGFYVGRYELGIEGGTLTTADVKYGYWTGGQAVVKQNSEPYNYISQTTAREVCRDLYPGQSYLIYGVQWDAIMKWLEKSEYDVVNDSSGWGNCLDSKFDFTGEYVDFTKFESDNSDISEVLNGKQLNWKKATKMSKSKGTAILMKTGTGGERNKAKNIFDIGGNLGEWTQEKYGTSGVVHHGGIFRGNGTTYPAVGRYPSYSAGPNSGIGARAALSIDLNSMDDLK